MESLQRLKKKKKPFEADEQKVWFVPCCPALRCVTSVTVCNMTQSTERKRRWDTAEEDVKDPKEVAAEAAQRIRLMLQQETKPLDPSVVILLNLSIESCFCA